MFVQIEKTPNPNTLKFLPGKKVSEVGPIEYVKKSDSTNELVRNIFSINGTNMQTVTSGRVMEVLFLHGLVPKLIFFEVIS